MKIVVICIGKKHDALLVDAINDYQKRIDRSFNLEWMILPQSSFASDKAREVESGAIMAKILPTDSVWLLDERGEALSSPNVSKRLEQAKTNGIARLVIVIGGAFGVNEQLRTRATLVWSLSNLVFPHQLVRLILVEQLYRALEIERGSGYHHN